MCSSTDPEDEKYLKPIADRQGIGWFAGEPTNIIKRHYDCALKNNVDWIINVDGDDVLTCPEIITYLKTCAEYSEQIGYDGIRGIATGKQPLGLNILSYSIEAIKNINNSSDTNWGALIKPLSILVCPDYEVYSDKYRLTLDYPEDFEVIKDVFINCPNNETVKGICSYLDACPEIAQINAFRNEEYWQRINKGGNA